MISTHIKDKKMIQSSHYRFKESKSNNLIAFYSGVAGLMDEGRKADVFHFDFVRLFTLSPSNVLLDKHEVRIR